MNQSFLVRMPKLSPTMEVGTIVKWHKKEGDLVKAGEVLLEVATDKATVEHQSLDAGYVRKILIANGADASVNQAIAILAPSLDLSIDNLIEQASAENRQSSSAQSVQTQNPAPLAPPAGSSTVTGTTPGLQQPQFRAFGPISHYHLNQDEDGAVKASPYAKKLAQERGIDITSIKGTGPDGRVVAHDLEGAVSASQWGVSFDSRAKPQVMPGTFELESLSPMRKAIAARLQESKTFIPHFYVSMEVDAKPLAQIQAQLKQQGLKISINDLVIRACAIALRKHPTINSGFDSTEQKLILFQTVDIAVAVALEGGLITPIIFHADYKSLAQISQSVKRLAKSAQQGTLEPHEYRGGSFTISNLGMYGVDNFQAIINPPQACILAVGGILEKPVVRAGKLECGQVMNLTLSCDHRVVDGADAAKFLVSVKQLLESPAVLLI